MFDSDSVEYPIYKAVDLDINSYTNNTVRPFIFWFYQRSQIFSTISKGITGYAINSSINRRESIFHLIHGY
jgi:hypothetical protein